MPASSPGADVGKLDRMSEACGEPSGKSVPGTTDGSGHASWYMNIGARCCAALGLRDLDGVAPAPLMVKLTFTLGLAASTVRCP